MAKIRALRTFSSVFPLIIFTYCAGSTIISTRIKDGLVTVVLKMKNHRWLFLLGWANIHHIFNIQIMNIFDLLFEYSNIIRIRLLFEYFMLL
jgi:hypothetical protein